LILRALFFQNNAELGKKGIFGQPPRNGFTLIELLVAMALFSMVTLVVALALKVAIDSWERGVEEGETIQLWVAIPALMEKQLRSLITTDPFIKGTEKHLPFCGQKYALSFFTAYAPKGSPYQGLLRTSYRFDEETKILELFEQVITRKEDLDDTFNPLSDDWGEGYKPVSQVPGITGFELAYSDRENPDPENTEHWKETWECISTTRPTGLQMALRFGEDSKVVSRKWYFLLGRDLP